MSKESQVQERGVSLLETARGGGGDNDWPFALDPLALRRVFDSSRNE